MNIDDLTLGQIKELANVRGVFAPLVAPIKPEVLDNKMIGKYVIVRCHDAGVHSGFLESYNGREAVLTQSRRLWYWKPADKQSFLSGVAVHGLHPDSKIGIAVPRIHLTEDCEITECSDIAKSSIMEIPAHEQ